MIMPPEFMWWSAAGLVFWRTKAINYVWASTSAKGKIWPNAFAGDHAHDACAQVIWRSNLYLVY